MALINIMANKRSQIYDSIKSLKAVKFTLFRDSYKTGKNYKVK